MNSQEQRVTHHKQGSLAIADNHKRRTIYRRRAMLLRKFAVSSGSGDRHGYSPQSAGLSVNCRIYNKQEAKLSLG